MRFALSVVRRLARMGLLIACVGGATILLTRIAPGYFSDLREMDAKYGQSEEKELIREKVAGGSVVSTVRSSLHGWIRGDLGISRQYQVPVRELIQPRLAVTASILFPGLICGWLTACVSALALSGDGRWTVVFGLPFTLLLAIPTGALATLFLLNGGGRPMLILGLLVASRDFKFLHHAFRVAWNAPQILYSRSQGFRLHQVICTHLIPAIWPQMLTIAMLSLVTALSAIVPIEVIFDQPGVGQLAWNAAMNRDMPVLIATSILMAVAVTFAGMFTQTGVQETV